MSYIEDCEPVGGMTFDGIEIDLAALPDNDRACEEAVATIQWVRLASVLLRCDDKAMEEHARAQPEAFLCLLEEIAPIIGTMRARLQFLDQASARMTIIMDRLIRDTERPLAPPAANVVTMGARHG